MTTIKNVIVSFFVIIILCQCTKDTHDSAINEGISSEYSVYSAILNQGFDKIKKPLVVLQTSDVEKSFAFDENVYENRIAPEGIAKEVFDDLLLKNDTVYELENKFDISPRKVNLVTTSDLQAVFKSTESIPDGTNSIINTLIPEATFIFLRLVLIKIGRKLW